MFDCPKCGLREPDQANHERLHRITDWAMAEGGKAVHRSWRDRMLFQNRDVTEQRKQWEALDSKDHLLDQGIALDVVLDYLRWEEKR